jgi:hypothetical protein
MPMAFKKDFMPLAFNPDGVFSPWQVSPPATENMSFTLFFLNLMTLSSSLPRLPGQWPDLG